MIDDAPLVRAMLEAQRVMAKIETMFESPAVNEVLRDFGRTSRHLSQNQAIIAQQVAAMNAAAPAIQQRLDQLNAASIAATRVQSQLTISDAQIQSAIRTLGEAYRTISPDLIAKLKFHTETNDVIQKLSVSLRQMARGPVNAAIEDALEAASTDTLDQLTQMADADGFSEVTSRLDNFAADLLNEKRSDERIPRELTTAEKVRLVLVIALLMWFFTLGEQNRTMGDELHTLSQNLIVAALFWDVVRPRDKS